MSTSLMYTLDDSLNRRVCDLQLGRYFQLTLSPCVISDRTA